MRVIARLDIKNEYVIKGIHLEGLRKVGEPAKLALKYYKDGIDELIFIDAVASLYERNNLFGLIEAASKSVFVPITVGGGIRSLSDVELALQAGADKVAINTAAIKDSDLVSAIANRYGSQCVVAYVEAKRIGQGWLAYMNSGRERTEKNVLEWVQCLEEKGAGEILITSIDRDGTKKGFDLELVAAVKKAVRIPVLGAGGAGKALDLVTLSKATGVEGAVCSSLFHYGLSSIGATKELLVQNQVQVRHLSTQNES